MNEWVGDLIDKCVNKLISFFLFPPKGAQMLEASDNAMIFQGNDLSPIFDLAQTVAQVKVSPGINSHRQWVE